MASQGEYKRYLPSDDSARLEDNFQRRHTGLLFSTDAERFVDMIVARFYTEISRNMFGRLPGITLESVPSSWRKWIDDEVHYAHKNAGFPTGNDDQYRTLRNRIIEEVGDRAAALFSRWNGTTQPPEGRDSTLYLRSTVWDKLAPDVPTGASSVVITTRDAAMAFNLAQQIAISRQGRTSFTDTSVTADITPENFPSVWRKCKLYHIPNTALRFQ